MPLEQSCVDQMSFLNHLFQSNFDQKPLANHQGFFQFLPHLKRKYFVNLMGLLRLMQPNNASRAVLSGLKVYLRPFISG